MSRITTLGAKLITKRVCRRTICGPGGRMTPTTSTKSQNLPSLPVPKLEDTMCKYLLTVQPLLNPEEYCKTERIVKDFLAPCGVGERLQKLLEDRSKCTENWLIDWWLEVAYLGYRDPVVLYSSPGQALPLVQFYNEQEWICYSAQVIVAAASYKTLIDSGKLPLDKMGKDPLDMNQYNVIFGTCRIPLLQKDVLDFNPKSKHIVVCHNNHFWEVELFDDKGKFLSCDQLICILQKIVDNSRLLYEPIGILTANQRDAWADAYRALVEADVNKCSVTRIQKCLFLVCLDQAICPDSHDSHKSLAGKHLIHGGGSRFNGGNRWFDKTIQFVFSKDGTVGLTYEHSPSEGQPVANMIDYIYNFLDKGSVKDIPTNPGICTEPKKLEFCLSDVSKQHICDASDTLDRIVNILNLQVFTFCPFGKDFIKKQKLSPDSFIQMAIQYAYYRLHGKPGAQYESGATRKYLHGRTDTIRSCSNESIKFAKSMVQNCSDEERAKNLREALNAHKKYAIDTVNGFGVDRHLLGLKLIAKENNIPLPALYDDISYKRSTKFVLSTSQVATKCDGFMCYGTLVEDGYGCCYNPRDNSINFAVSSIRTCPDTNAQKFASTLEFCLSDMQRVLCSTMKSKI